jgi:CDP-diacylglycerol pyrophosphatase
MPDSAAAIIFRDTRVMALAKCRRFAMMGGLEAAYNMPVNAKLGRVLLLLVAAAAAFPAAGKPPGGLHTPGEKSADLAPDAGPDALRQIVQDHCVINWTQHKDPAPCERVFLADAKASNSGYAVLADIKGGAHYLLIPTQTMAGTESGELLDPDNPNYFAEAWHARDLITKFVGHEVPRTAVALAVNTAHSRTQNQFHVHVECLRQDVADSLHAAADKVSDTWSPVNVAGSTYQALKISDSELDGANPFELVANLSSDAKHHMGNYTLVVAGMQFKSGPGFILLTGTGPTGELLLDSSCAVAGGGG